MSTYYWDGLQSLILLNRLFFSISWMGYYWAECTPEHRHAILRQRSLRTQALLYPFQFQKIFSSCFGNFLKKISTNFVSNFDTNFVFKVLIKIFLFSKFWFKFYFRFWYKLSFLTLKTFISNFNSNFKVYITWFLMWFPAPWSPHDPRSCVCRFATGPICACVD